VDYKVSISALVTSNALKEQGIVGKARDIVARRTKSAAKTTSETAAMTTEEEEEPSPPCTLEVSEEEMWPSKADLEAFDERSFVNVVDLLPPVPEKGEFDVNKIMTSLYFFS